MRDALGDGPTHLVSPPIPVVRRHACRKPIGTLLGLREAVNDRLQPGMHAPETSPDHGRARNTGVSPTDAGASSPDLMARRLTRRDPLRIVGGMVATPLAACAPGRQPDERLVPAPGGRLRRSPARRLRPGRGVSVPGARAGPGPRHGGPHPVALARVSDGAPYALGLGRANGRRFTHLLAFSPGFLIPVHEEGVPQDPVHPIATCSRRLVPALPEHGYPEHGYEILYRGFDGGHEVPSAAASEGLGWLLGRL
jgi:hypothetical protein